MQLGNYLTVAELKEVLRALKLPTTGRKAELIARLGHAVSTGSRMDSSAPEIIGTFENVESPEVVALEEVRAPEGSQMNSPVLLEAGNVTSESMLREDRAPVLSLPWEGTSNESRENRELEWTKRKRETIQSEIEIIEPNNELLKTNAGSMAFPHSDYTRAVADLLEDFDGSTGSFANWEKQVRLLKWMHQLDENFTRILISSKLKGRALTWFHSRSEHLQYSTEDLLLEIQRMYDHHPSRVALRKAFEERKWRVGESFGDYFHEKVIMASRVPIPEDEMVNYIVEGIADLGLRDQARMQNFKEKWSLLKSFENVTLRPEPSDMTNINSSYNVTGTSFVVDEDCRSELQKCYNCDETGHSSSNCTRPNGEKGSSGRFEHRKRNCSEGKSNSRVSTLSKEPFEKDDFVKDITNKNSCGDKYHILHLDVLLWLDSGSAVSFIKARFVPNDAIAAADNK